MSDQHFTSMLILSTFLYARGLRRTDAGHERALLAGSFGASLAILVRQQGVLIPLAVIVFMLLTQRLAGDRRGIRRVAYVSAVPFATFVAYYLWLQGVHGTVCAAAYRSNHCANRCRTHQDRLRAHVDRRLAVRS
jgi:4-amino-4-deoxy-L-arabinose transferase-like glycosyltransferase